MRVYLVGTDTGVGKTTVAMALLRTAGLRSLRAVPFKPAESGDATGESDIARLLRSANLDPALAPKACPHRYDSPVAPGIAEDPRPFTEGFASRDDQNPEPAPLLAAEAALARWEQEQHAQLTVIEGAGGLHVPMPGGSWQPRWIDKLAPYTVVVGREGLGTINHTLTTIVGLRHLGRTPLGFILSATHADHDPSTATNAAVIASASGVRHLGTLPFSPSGRPAPAPDLLDALRARLPKLAKSAN